MYMSFLCYNDCAYIWQQFLHVDIPPIDSADDCSFPFSVVIIILKFCTISQVYIPCSDCVSCMLVKSEYPSSAIITVFTFGNIFTC